LNSIECKTDHFFNQSLTEVTQKCKIAASQSLHLCIWTAIWQ